MRFLILYLFALLCLLPQTKQAVEYPQNYFKSPLDIPLTIAGNFGEPRKGHFHTGLDFKTNEETGHKVFAAADGYVSRINVSSGGYGNALYITHPNGFVTVYGHLKEYSAAIMERLRKEQYAKESFSVDFPLPPGEISVKQGDVVALSGNTGASGGPHLHFEIRDAAENAINPLLFGIQLLDDIKPAIHFLKFYPMDSLKYKCDGYREKVSGKEKEGVYTINNTVALNSSLVGISVNTYDMINQSESDIGIYDMRLYNDSKLIYEYRVDRMTFTENRYVISQLDYPIFLNEGNKNFQKCFVEPGNHLPVYHYVANRGIIDLSDGKMHDIKIAVSDFAGNTSNVNLKVKYDATSKLFKPNDLTYIKRFDYDHENEFTDADIKLEIPKGCLLDTVYFNHTAALATMKGVFSKVHQVDRPSTQAFEWFYISLKAEKLPTGLRDKAVVVYKDERGTETSRGGKYDEGFVKAKGREFGTYFIRIDTTAPEINPVNIEKGKNMRKEKKILVKISDDLSGIANFSTYLDGKWVVTDYDGKSSTLTHTLDAQLSAGEHVFKVVVTDERKNTAEYSVGFRM